MALKNDRKWNQGEGKYISPSWDYKQERGTRLSIRSKWVSPDLSDHGGEYSRVCNGKLVGILSVGNMKKYSEITG